MQMSAKSAATKNTWVDPDDAPELTDTWFENADLHKGTKLIRRGRPTGTTKTSTTLRFDVDILEAFKATGKGWQTRMNNALRDWLKNHSPSPNP
jgi:uncharacterized protein (DUF4415 family)